MAVIGTKESTSLKIVLDAGILDGRQRIQTKSFNKIKTTASDQGLYDTAMALGSLQKKDLLNIKRVEEIVLNQE